MTSGCDDLLPAAALSVAVAALQQVQRQARTHRTIAEWEVALRSVDDAFEFEDVGDEEGPPVKRNRLFKKRRDWRTSAWWIQLQDSDLLDYTTDAAKDFRTRFRVPHPFFLELVELAKNKEWFSTGDRDAAGRNAIPIELKVSFPKKVATCPCRDFLLYPPNPPLVLHVTHDARPHFTYPGRRISCQPLWCSWVCTLTCPVQSCNVYLTVKQQSC